VSRRALARALFALGLALLLAGAWGSWPRRSHSAWGGGRALELVLLDLSDSARGARPAWSRAVVALLEERAQAARAAEADWGLIAFARGAELVREPGPAGPDDLARLVAPLAQRDGGASELAAALDLAAAVLERRGAAGGTLTIVGDPTSTGPDPGARLAGWRARGFRVVLREPGPARPEVLLGEPELPRELRPGQALALRVPLYFAAGAERAWLALTVEGPGGPVELQRSVERPRGVAADAAGMVLGHAALTLAARAEGWHTLELRAGATQGRADAPPRRAALRVGSATLVLLCESAGADARLFDALSAALAARGTLAVERCAPAELAAGLARADVVISGDVAPAELAALPARELAAFVERGGGWLALAEGRWAEAFAAEPAPSALLPFAPHSDAAARRDIAFLVDGSGSMAGDPQLALQQALVDVLAQLAPAEAVEFRWFAGELGAPLLRQPGADAATRARFAAALLAAHPPGGPTHLGQSLASWLATRGPGAAPALVFLFSDGRESDPALGDRAARLARARELAARAAGAQVKVIPVAVGAEPDAELLSALQPAGQPLERAGSLQDPAARERLARLVARTLASERAAPPGEQAVRAADARTLDARAASVRTAQLALRAEPWPSIARPQRVSPRVDAQVLWRTADGSPLLALRSAGLGATAATAFALGEPGRAWGTPEWLALFAPLVEALARARAAGAAAGAEPALSASDEGLVLTGADPRELEIAARLAAADAEAIELTFVAQLEPAAGAEPIPSWRAAWPAELRAAAGGRAELRLALDPPRTFFVALPAPETRLPRRVWSLPAAADAPFEHPPPARTAGSAAWAWGAGLAALVVLGLAAWIGAGATRGLAPVD